MSELTQPSLAIYNPGLLAREDLARQFVARTGLLARLLDDLRAPNPNHHLLIGHRGMGKTTMLCRLRHCIEDDEALNARWMPLSFPEEQYNVSRLSDLWLNCLDALCDALEQRGEAAHAKRLDALIDALPADEALRSVATLDALKAWMAEHRGLVLLFDNLDLVLSRLDDAAHWAVRELMSQRDDLVIIGASSQPVDAMADYGAPFYEFFRVDELRGLSEAEARDVLIALAEAHDTPRVIQVVTTQPGRFRALHVLTGGNPRTLVLLYQVLAHDDSSDVHVDLERLLDQCTPLYKDRFESLPPQAQQLVDALALRWDPSSAHDLAEHTRLDVNAVSSQLNRLVKQGVIEKVALPNTKRAGFQLAERFFNIWYLMRASRRVRRRLMWLVRFLELFYGERELGGRAQRLLGRGGDSRGAELALAYARSESLSGSPLARALEHKALDVFAEHGQSRRMLRELLDLEGEDSDLKDPVERRRVLREAEQLVLSADVDWEAVGCTAEEFWGLLGGSPSLPPEGKYRVATVMQTRTSEQIRLTKGLFIQFAEQWDIRWGTSARRQVQRALRCGELRGFRAEGDVLDAQAVALRRGEPEVEVVVRAEQEGVQSLERDLVGSSQVPLAWLILGESERSEGRPQEAELAIRRALELSPKLVGAWGMLGDLLQVELERFSESETAYRRAIELDGSAAFAWHRIGDLLQDHLGRFDESEAAYRRAIELDGTSSVSWSGLASLLQHHLGRFDESEEAYRRSIELETYSALPWYGVATLFERLDRFEEAEAAYRRATELSVSAALPWRRLGNLLELMGRFADSKDAYLRAIELDVLDEQTPARLGVILGSHLERPEEAEQVLRQALDAVANSAVLHNALAWHIYRHLRVPAEALHHAVVAVELEPKEQACAHTLSCIAAWNDDWPLATKFARQWLADPDATNEWDWEDTTAFFMESTLTNHAPEALQLLIEADLEDRWRPLAEALRAATDPEHLLGVAPEVRAPAQELLDRWEAERRRRATQS